LEQVDHGCGIRVAGEPVGVLGSDGLVIAVYSGETGETAE